MTKKKLVIVIPSLRGGGAERVMVNILRNLDRKKFDIRLILIKKEGPYVSLVPDDVSVIDLNANRVRYALLKLIKELNTFKPDVILSTLGHLNLALLILKPLIKGSPRIVVREANTPSKSMGELSTSKKKVFWYLYKKLYPKADLIIAQCKDMKKDIMNSFNIDEGKIKYIYNPLDLALIESKMRQGNPYNPKKINFIATGRLTYQKGFDILIDAFKEVNDKLPNAHLTILGKGELENHLKQQVEKLKINENVTFAGFKENPYPYYYYADTYVLSSRWEGFPNTLLEALACGVKVVATDCQSGPREILEDNEYGILVRVGDFNSLSQGMISSYLEVNKTHNRADNFRIDKIIKDYEAILS